jgi:PhnB protein
VPEALVDRINHTIDQLLAGEDASPALRDPALAGLARIASELRLCPRAAFKTRLRANLKGRTMMSTVLEPVTVREGFTTVTPYLRVEDPGFVDFLVKTFGAAETLSHPAGPGMTHREVRVGDSMLMIGEGGVITPEQRRPQSFHVFVEDVDATYDRAIAAGAKSLGAVEDRSYGERSGFVEDPFGNYWYLARHLGPTPVPAGYRTLTPYLHPRRAGALIEFLTRGLGATEEFRHALPDGRVMHAQVRCGNAVLEMGESEAEGVPRSAVFYLYVTDADALFAQAVAAGATPLAAPADQWYGDRVASVQDPSGIIWYIARPA